MKKMECGDLKMQMEEMRKEIDALKSELAASMEREELALNPVKKSKTLREKIKKTKIGTLASNPNSKIGKIIRLPRTAYRIVKHPNIILKMASIKKIKSNEEKNSEERTDGVFAPIDFIYSDDKTRRVNLVLKKLDAQRVREAINFAKQNDYSLRIITCEESVNPIKFKGMTKNNKIEGIRELSFYSSYDQEKTEKPFKLEVGKNDIFLTTIWGMNE